MVKLKVFYFVVAQDGSGDFQKEMATIFVKKGVYKEVISGKHPLFSDNKM